MAETDFSILLPSDSESWVHTFHRAEALIWSIWPEAIHRHIGSEEWDYSFEFTDIGILYVRFRDPNWAMRFKLSWII